MKLYLSDLDGTLLNYAAKLKPRASDILNRLIDKGVLFSYATARGFISSREITADLKLNLPLITMNGAIICDPNTGKPLTNNFLSDKSCSLALDFFKEYGETPLVYSYIDGVERVSYLENDTKRIKFYLSTRKGDPRLRSCKSYDELAIGDIFYLCMWNPKNDADCFKKVFTEKNGFSDVYYKDAYSDELLFEFFNAGVSKASALLELKKLTGADKIIAFGDNFNDIPMFEVADECYAVQNAVEELKAIATGIIPGNEEMGVPVFIEKRETKVWDYTPPAHNPEKFKNAIQNNSKSGGVGELNEKPIHAVLKRYFSAESDREAKIGSFYADAAGESGIFEIQTSGWGALNKKLEVFLEACHVTVVYPFEQRVHNIALHEITGELLKRPATRNNKDLTEFFIELYRIKSFLTHPNLTVCLANLEIEKTRYEDPEKPRKRGQKRKQDKRPLALLSEIHLNCGEDYKIFLPDNLPETFTKKEFQKLLKICEAGIMLTILEYLSVIHKKGKKGNEFLYSLQLLGD